jgi:transporter family-2 protein
MLGAFYVASSTVVAAELGTASLLGLALAGQLATALVIDHFGWLGMPEHPITWVRAAGVLLLASGVWLITR